MKRFFTGLIFGGLAGAIVGLVNTPYDGKTNRKVFKKYINDVSYAAKDLQGDIAQGQIAITDLAQQGISSLKVARDEITLAIDDFNRTTVPQRNRLQEKIAQTQSHLAESQIKFQANKQK
ncbi:hypothetical protein AWM75_06140 [Aerococcus urinaehominis]|uniref:Uncharacterized protein n=1 Tax=Aerococcus urinaehominis TaxID=128944 RepID=A0A0X8FLN3_9LACT|nr:YtxH domain-containing protein [Aerococcus urinaehominis]AMB99584.1 hypothetical protein AWM75_06140 [Aerococcus urinaehominis]SDL86434.1 Gas vesicle protein [Aerococcus urinaehominis]